MRLNFQHAKYMNSRAQFASLKSDQSKQPPRTNNPKIASVFLDGNELKIELIDDGTGIQSQQLDSALIRLLKGREDQLVLLRVRKSARKDEKTEKQLVEILNRGFVLPGHTDRKYVYLAASNSGIKSGSCYCIDEELWAEVIQGLGSFDKAMKDGINKLQSRIGLIASTSISSVDLKDDELVDIEDIVNIEGDYSYELTDGAGILTQDLAQRIALSASLDEVPSVFQIRVAGYKGVVVAYPDDSDIINKLRQRPGAENAHLFLRPSMKKFESNSRSISVLNYSRRMRGNLTRQLLTMLHDLTPLAVETEGVSRAEALALMKLDTYISKLRLAAEDHKVAREMIVEHSSLDDEDVQTRMLGSQINMIDRLLHAKVSLNDHLLRELLQYEILQKLHNIVKGSKFNIPGSIGDFLIGIPDETGTLEEGQVVVCVSTNNHDQHYYFEGKVAVTRYPVNHAGSIRMLEAVKPPPGLSHLCNVIVFPVTTKRPVQDMMGGGDLDGDLYLVIQETNLHFEESRIPLNYKEVADDDDIVELDTASDNNLNSINENTRMQLCKAFVTQKDEIGLMDWFSRIVAEIGGVGSDDYEYLAKRSAVELDGAKSGKRLKAMCQKTRNRWNSARDKFVWTSKKVQHLFDNMFSDREKFLEDARNVLEKLKKQDQIFNEKTQRRRLFNIILFNVLVVMVEIMESNIDYTIDPDLDIRNLLVGDIDGLKSFSKECDKATKLLEEWGKDWKELLKKQPEENKDSDDRNKRTYQPHRVAVVAIICDRTDGKNSNYDYEEDRSKSRMFLKYRAKFEKGLVENGVVKDEHMLQIRASAWHVACAEQFEERKSNGYQTVRFSRLSSVCVDKLCDLKVRQLHKRSREQKVQQSGGGFVPTFSPIVLA